MTERNPYHVPAGSSKGGQFASGQLKTIEDAARKSAGVETGINNLISKAGLTVESAPKDADGMMGSYGAYSKKITLYGDIPPEQKNGVLAHELGHHYLHSIYKKDKTGLQAIVKEYDLYKTDTAKFSDYASLFWNNKALKDTGIRDVSIAETVSEALRFREIGEYEKVPIGWKKYLEEVERLYYE